MNIEEEILKLQDRVSELETLTIQFRTIGPNPKQAYELEAERLETIAKIVEETKQLHPIPPVDRSARVLGSGAPVLEDYSHTELRTDGQQKDYVVLTADERHKGYVRRYRDAYTHLKCGKVTTMSRAIAETYARDPGFYNGTFCSTCMKHFPIGEDGEFVWFEMDGSTGPKVGT